MSYPYSSLYLEGQWSKLKLAKLFHSEPEALGCGLSPWNADRVPASSELPASSRSCLASVTTGTGRAKHIITSSFQVLIKALMGPMALEGCGPSQPLKPL